MLQLDILSRFDHRKHNKNRDFCEKTKEKKTAKKLALSKDNRKKTKERSSEKLYLS